MKRVLSTVSFQRFSNLAASSAISSWACDSVNFSMNFLLKSRTENSLSTYIVKKRRGCQATFVRDSTSQLSYFSKPQLSSRSAFCTCPSASEPLVTRSEPFGGRIKVDGTDSERHG